MQTCKLVRPGPGPLTGLPNQRTLHVKPEAPSMLIALRLQPQAISLLSPSKPYRVLHNKKAPNPLNPPNPQPQHLLLMVIALDK